MSVLIDALQRRPLLGLPTSQKSVRIWAALLVLLAAGLGILNGEVINRDGIVYVTTAQTFLDGGVKAAMQVYNWPAYSILFGVISAATGLSLVASAYLLNTLFMLLLVDAFIRLSRVLLGEALRPWIAALVILSFPPLDHRLDIYRDWGYLALTLCALVPLLRYWKSDRVLSGDVVVWQLCMIGAFLFRVEAVSLVALAPLGFLFQKRAWSLRIKRFLAAYSLVSLAVMLGGLVVFAGEVPLGKLAEFSQYLNPQHVFSSFNQMADQIALHALNKYSDDYAPLIFGGGIVTLVGWMTLDNLGAFLVLLTGVGLFRYRLPESVAYRQIYWLLAIAVLTLSLFLSVNLIPPSRYALLGSLLLLTLTVYAVNAFADAKASKRAVSRYWWWFMVVGLLIGNLANFTFHQDYKSYLRDGGRWIAQNLPPTSVLITNDFIIDYYAQRQHGEKIDSMPKLKNALTTTQPPFYVALKTKDRDRIDFLQLLGREPVIEFHSGHAKEGMLIFHVDGMASRRP
jgi:hypothetical protein